MPHKDPEARRQYQKEYAAKNHARRLEIQRSFRARNAESVREYQREYQRAYYHSKLKNDPAYIEQNRKCAADWYKENPERAKLTAKAHCTKRRGLIAKAMPGWANAGLIKAIYAEAVRKTKETGIQHEVDHIIPLRGKKVTGLHCEANLRVVTKAENRSKGAKELTP